MRNFIDALTPAAYAAVLGLPLYTGPDIPSGVVHVANADRLTEGYFSEPLTQIAVGGWNSQDVTAEVDHLCGTPIRVSRRFEYHAWDNAESFASDADDTRSIGGDFKEVRLTASKPTGKTLNRGLIMRIDKDEVDDMAQAEVTRVSYLTERLRLNQFRRAFALLSAAATNTARTWGSGTPSPDTDMLTTLATAADTSGLKPNTVTFGETAWISRLVGSGALATATGFAVTARGTEEALRQYLGVEKLRVSRARFQSAAATKTRVVGTRVISHYASTSPMSEDPSNIKYFYTPCEGGGRVRAFRWQPNDKTVFVGVEHYELLAITYSGGIRQETVS